jgi:hypothetical protein
MRALSLAILAAAAMPTAAQAPAFRLGIACDGAMPVAIEIHASRAGSTLVTVEELLAFCMLHAPADEPKPVPQRWRST